MLTNMISLLGQASRTNCVMYDLRSNSALCETCKSETREDFYLLLLKMFKDQHTDYLGLQAKCIDMHDVIDHYLVPEVPIVVFDQNVHVIDENAKELFENHSVVSTDQMVPIEAGGDGNCLFHTLRMLYPTMTIDELRARCIEELCTHEQYYETLKTEVGLNLVDNESVQDHVLRILDSRQYTNVLTFAALFAVIGQPIESIYSNVNEYDAYVELLNIIFIPRDIQQSSLETPIRIMWSGSKKEADRVWCANRFTPILNINQSTSLMETECSIEIFDVKVEGLDTNETQPQTILRSNKPTIWYSAQMEKEIENKSKATSSTSAIDKKHIFLETSTIIQQMITAVKVGKVFDHPPKTITHASIFMIKH